MVAAFTVFATWFGAETCIGAAGAIHDRGLAGGSADPFGYAICVIVTGLVFAVPLWRLRLTTLADLFRLRFDALVERLAVLLIVPTSLFWAAAQVRAFGQVLSSASGLEIDPALTIAAGVVIAYTMFGGLLADAWTDLLQGVALIVGLVAACASYVLAAVLGSAPSHDLKAQRARRYRMMISILISKCDAYGLLVDTPALVCLESHGLEGCHDRLVVLEDP